MNRLAAAALLTLMAASVAAPQTAPPGYPVVTSVSPNQVVAGSPDTVVTLTGSNFTQLDQVLYDGWALAATYVDANHLRVTIPSSYLLAPSVGYFYVISAVGGYSESVPFSVTIPFTTPSGLPPATLGQPYLQPITIKPDGTFPPYLWMVSAGSLPPGLSLDSETGELSGTPKSVGVFSFTVTVQDGAGPFYEGPSSWGERAFLLSVNPAQSPLSIWFPDALPDGAVGKSYGENLYAGGGTGLYSWSGSSLPPGLTIASTGVVVGTPTQAGTFTISITVTDGVGASASKTYSLKIAPSDLEIVTASPLPGATVGVAYSQALVVKGGQPPFVWVVRRPPAGLTLDSATGTISGVPTAAASFAFTVQVTDSLGNAVMRDFVLVVQGLSITTTSPLPVGSAGSTYSVGFTAAAGSPPYTWSISGTAAGLAIDPASGVLSGTPASVGTYRFIVQVKDSAGATAAREFDLTINRAQLAIVTGSLTPGKAAAAYSQQVQANGGAPPYTWSAAGLPSGLAIDPATGTISGTPAGAGPASVAVQVTDSTGGTATKTFTLTVGPPSLPQINFGGSGTANPAEQVTLTGSLGSGYPLQLSGQLTMAFTPDAGSVADDPAIQFATGGRTFNFTVAPNSPQFPAAGLQTGTVAGTIVITLSRLEAGETDMTPSPLLTQTLVVNRRPPAITSIAIVRTATGFEAQINGYSTTREVTQARFTFAAAPGSNVQTADFTVPVGSTFTTWYSDAASKQFGSMFRYVQPFSVQGGVSGLASVTVTLSNSVGSSQPATANF